MTITTKPVNDWISDLLLLAIALVLLNAIGLGTRPYMNPSEARMIEIPRQMLATGDWLTPRINAVPYFEKPPLFFWMQAAVMNVFGTHEAAGRTTSVLLATLTALLTYTCARLRYTRTTGLLAATILATTLMGFALARLPGLDLPLTFFVSLSLACFLHAPRVKHPTYLYWLMAIASALAVLTKGLIGALLPALIIGAWIAHTRQWQLLWRMRPFSGLLLFLIIVLPWHGLMQLAHPGFLDFYLLHEHLDRFTTDTHHRTAPWWFFIVVTLAGLFPWLPLLPGALRTLHPKTNPQDSFLLLWITLPLLFFSFSHSKLPGYIFPIFPPLSILLAHKACKLWNNDIPIRSLRYDCLFVLAILALACALPFLPASSGKAGELLARVTALPIATFWPLAVAAALLCLTLITRRNARTHIMALALLGACLGHTLDHVAARTDTSGTKPFAQFLKPVLLQNAKIVAFESYWQDLPVYLETNITVAGYQGELAYGISVTPPTQEWMISTDAFWKRCANTAGPLYVFIRQTRYHTLTMPPTCTLTPLANFGDTMLLKKTIP